MAKVIGVTGASGFIGGSICIELKKRGYKVLALDRVKRKYLLPYYDSFYHTDFENIANYGISSPWYDCSTIIHCAGDIMVNESIKHPSRFFLNNVSKTIGLLDWCSSNNKHFMFSSTASVYNTKSSPLVEEDPKGPISPYSKSKWMVEEMVQAYEKAYNLKSTIFRFFNACGAVEGKHGQPPGAEHIFPKIYESKKHSTPFVLNGEDYNTPDGTCVRDYIHVSDIADAHIKAIEKSCYGVYNLGSGHGYSNRQIIDAVGLNSWASGVRRPGDTDVLISDNSLAKAVLEWVPRNSLTDIITDLNEWYSSKTYSGLQDHPA